MADLTITPANVGINSGSVDIRAVQVGEAVTQGEPGYLGAGGKYFLADADNTVATAAVECIFLTPAAIDGFAVAAFSGSINIGATLTVGEQYYASDTPGGIKPAGDLVTGDFVTFLGVASSASALEFAPNATGIEVPA